MSYSLLVSEKAQMQISKASQWFFEQSPGLELKFIHDLDKAMKLIKKRPLHFQVRYKTVRIKFLDKFNFGIHYIIENNTVFVLYVFHTSQNSNDWF